MASVSDKKHPHLTKSLLFSSPISPEVKENNIQEILRRLNLRTAAIEFRQHSGSRDQKFVRLRFPDIASAEKALTLVQHELSATKPPHPAGIPRILQNSGPIFPAILYDKLRSFGPLAFIRSDRHPFHRIFLRFYEETDSVLAVAHFHTETAMKLIEYDDYSIFCANLPASANKSCLEALFSPYGTIERFRSGNGFAFIRFTSPEAALEAVRARHRHSFHDSVRPMIVRFEEKRTSDVPRSSIHEPSQTGPMGSSEPQDTVSEMDAVEEPAAPPYTSVPQTDETPEIPPQEPPPKSPLPSGPPKEPDYDSLSSRLVEIWKEEAARLAIEVTALRVKLASKYTTHDEEMSMLKDELSIFRLENGALARDLESSQSRCKMLEMEVDQWRREDADRRKLEEEAEERKHEAAVEESRRKLQEFINEEKERKKQENLVKAERERKIREEKERKEKAEREEQAREVEERRKKEEKRLREIAWSSATITEQIRCVMRDQKLGCNNLLNWNAHDAFCRFKCIINEFETSTFNESKPLTIRAIPWPTLKFPSQIKPEELEWSHVEQFFIKVRSFSKDNEYKAMIQKVYLMFHPDRWKSRGILLSIMDDSEREVIENAGNVVSQAMTPLWKDSRSIGTS